MKKLLASILVIVMALSMAACNSKSGENSTVVGRWAYIDKSESWELGFTEDGDFYDSLGKFMSIQVNLSYEEFSHGSWRIRADGKMWFTTYIPDLMHDNDWAYSYELDGDTLRIGGKTFTRIS